MTLFSVQLVQFVQYQMPVAFIATTLNYGISLLPHHLLFASIPSPSMPFYYVRHLPYRANVFSYKTVDKRDECVGTFSCKKTFRLIFRWLRASLAQ